MKKLIGKTVVISSYRGDKDSYLVKVLSIRDTKEMPIRLKTIQENRITRSQHLLTGMHLDTEHVKSYYVEMGQVKEVGFFGRLWFKFSRKIGG